MKVSIIIPAYNEEKYLAATIEAALNQSHPDFEVIIVDNASTDRTAEIARSFPVKLVHEANQGTQWARERGRLEASGEILAYLDADCLPDKDWLARGVERFDERVVAVAGPYDYFDAANHIRYILLYSQKLLYFPANVLAQYLRLGAVMIAGNSLFRASALEKIGGHDTSILFWGDDTDTAKRISKIGRVVWSNQLTLKTSARRLHSQGILKTLSLYLLYFFKVIFRYEGAKK